LSYKKQYDSILNEAFQQNIPIIACIDFTSKIFLKKVAYNMCLPTHGTRLDSKIFFIELFKYITRLTKVLRLNTVKQILKKKKETFFITDNSNFFRQRRFIKVFFMNKKKISNITSKRPYNRLSSKLRHDLEITPNNASYNKIASKLLLSLFKKKYDWKRRRKARIKKKVKK
jgi:hypothetical protein